MVFVEYQSAKGGEGKREGCLGVICKREPADLIIWYGEYGESTEDGVLYLGYVCILGYTWVYLGILPILRSLKVMIHTKVILVLHVDM